ncbi:hypothetical protein BG000_007413 [Podila horticola]|nr:hypothetical protein BG000_007413 [Podila horticola]
MNPSSGLQYFLLLLGLALLVLFNTLFLAPEDTQSRGANARDYALIALDTLPALAIVLMYALVLTGRHLNNGTQQRHHYRIHVACRVVCTLAIAAMVCYLPALRIIVMKRALAYDPSMEDMLPSPPLSANSTTTTTGPWTFRQMYFCDKTVNQALEPSFVGTCVKHLAMTGVSFAVALLLVVELAVAGVWGDLRKIQAGEEVEVVEDEKKKMPMEGI